ncbi:MAG: hypothetical protein JRN68_03105 [Nitrososphaerota archaeon]|jgi:hypothetical protein|nr:hypothetical protein [Nitrososphaerota archaeon]
MLDYPRRRVVSLAALGGFGVLVMGAIAYMMSVPNTGGAPFFVAASAAMLTGLGSMAYASGWTMHIITGVIIGAIFGDIIATAQKLNISSIGKGIALGAIAGIVVRLVFFMPLMAPLMPALLGVSMMVVGSLFAHLIFWIMVGSVTFLAVRSKTSLRVNSIVGDRP